MEETKPADHGAEQTTGHPHRVRLPGFIKDEEIGLGDAIKKATYAMGIKPCGGCEQRAAADPCAALWACCASGNPACCETFRWTCLCPDLQACCARGVPGCCDAELDLCLCPLLGACCAAGNPVCCRSHTKLCVCPRLAACCNFGKGPWWCCAIGQMIC